MRPLSALLACLLVLGCELRPTTDGGAGGGGNGGAGEGGSKATSTTGAASCDELPDCVSCRSCAADGPCKQKVDLCLEEPLCVQLDECIALCGISPDCTEVCVAQYASVAELYAQARECLDCAVCDPLCKAVTACQ